MLDWGVNCDFFEWFYKYVVGLFLLLKGRKEFRYCRWGFNGKVGLYGVYVLFEGLLVIGFLKYLVNIGFGWGS